MSYLLIVVIAMLVGFTVLYFCGEKVMDILEDLEDRMVHNQTMRRLDEINCELERIESMLDAKIDSMVEEHMPSIIAKFEKELDDNA